MLRLSIVDFPDYRPSPFTPYTYVPGRIFRLTASSPSTTFFYTPLPKINHPYGATATQRQCYFVNPSYGHTDFTFPPPNQFVNQLGDWSIVHSFMCVPRCVYTNAVVRRTRDYVLSASGFGTTQ